MPTTVVLKSTKALGDIVIASALQKALSDKGYHTGVISKKEFLPLWNGLENTSTYSFEEQPDVFFDISDYLRNFPGSIPTYLPREYIGEEKVKGHLCQWMAYQLFHRQGIHVIPSRDDVRIVLTRNEVEFGRDYVYKISKDNKNKPIIILAPTSSTKNKNLPRKTVELVVKGISDFSVPCLQLPPNYDPSQVIKGSTPLCMVNLRQLAAVLLSANAILAVDSGPLHIAMGVIQGTQVRLDGVNADPNKVVVALGSSHREVVAYKNNRIVLATGDCEVAPCSAHGYWPVEKYSEHLNVEFFEAGTARDKSGCMFEDYSSMETAPCMEAISADEIVEGVKEYLSK